MSFEKGGKRITLKEGRETSTCKRITGKSLHRVIRSNWSKLTQLFSIVAMEEGPKKMMCGELTLSINNEQGKIGQVHSNYLIDKLLVEFEDLFAEPDTLPLTRNLDHSINLNPNFEPVYITAY